MSNVTVIHGAKRKRALPEIVDAGGQEIIASHKFNVERVAEWMMRKGINSWVSIQDVAKFVYGNARQCNIRAVRGRYHALRTFLLSKDHLLIKEPGQRPWLSCKLYVGGSEIEKQAADEYFEETRKKLSHERYERARVIFENTNTVREMERAGS